MKIEGTMYMDVLKSAAMVKVAHLAFVRSNALSQEAELMARTIRVHSCRNLLHQVQARG